MAEYNPIKSVGGIAVACPSSYQWEEEDVSDSDAGRTEDGLMHKNEIRKVVKLTLSWQNISIPNCAAILAAFDANEYFAVEYLDAKAGGYKTKTFYQGNRATPLYNAALGIWSNVSLNIIEV